MQGFIRSQPKFPKFAVLLAAGLALIAPAEAGAQYGKTFRTATKLSSADIDIIRKVVREDLTGKPNGTTLPWSNPQSQNSGTVTLLGSFPSQGRDCRRVKYLINPGPGQLSSAKPAAYVLTNCRLEDGTWKIDDKAKPDKVR